MFNNQKVFSLSFHPDLFPKNYMENANKIIVSSQLLNNYNNSEPMNVKITKVDESIIFKDLYLSVQEFSAQENIAFLPSNLMDELILSDGDLINIEIINVPKVKSINLKPLDKEFYSLDNYKDILTSAFIENYLIISQGEIIIIDNIKLLVNQLLPENVVSTYNTDPEIIFDKPDFPLDEDEDNIEETKMESTDNDDTEFKPFSGQGYSLSGKKIVKKDNPDNSPKIFTPFSGKGYKLG